MVAQHFVILLLSLLEFGRADDIPNCTEGTKPELKDGQNFCFFTNYSREVPAVGYYGQQPIEINVTSNLLDLGVNEELVFWRAHIQISMVWSDNRILMDENVNTYESFSFLGQIHLKCVIKKTFCFSFEFNETW